jgi:hypothetical protein
MKTVIRHARLAVDPLEPRHAPASALAFTDVDGDRVTVTASAGNLTGRATFAEVGLGRLLQRLDLTGAEFQGATIATAVARAATGDGLVNIGHIDAAGRDLGGVTVKGDLGQIDAGDADSETPGLGLLSVVSMGRLGTATQAGAGNLSSDVTGGLGSLRVKGDLDDVVISVNGGVNGTVGGVFIGGSLIGRDGGRLQADGDIGRVEIGGDLVGGTGSASGKIFTNGRVLSLKVGGSVLGGSGVGSGGVATDGGIGPTTVGGDVRGGPGPDSGLIFTGGALARVDVAGSLIGTGVVSAGDLGPATVGGDAIDSVIAAGGNLARVAVRGSLIGREANPNGITSLSGVLAVGDLGPVTIGRDLVGRGGDESAKVTAGGTLAGLAVGGSLRGGSGRYDTNPGQLGTGQIVSFGRMGPVTVGGDVVGGGDQSAKIVSHGSLAGLTVGGSLRGGPGAYGTGATDPEIGQVVSLGDLGPVKIGQDVVGGAGRSSARIRAGGALAGLTVGGSLVGGPGDQSGLVESEGDLGPVRVGRDLVGGPGLATGLVFAHRNLAGVAIGGSVRGGPAEGTGGVESAGDVGPVTIGRDLVGGSITGSASLDGSGFVVALGRIAAVKVGGSIISGVDDSTGRLTTNATILAGDDLGSLTVRGSLVGHRGPNGDSPVVISARGQAAPGPAADLAIGRVTVGGRVEFARILAGYDPTGHPVNGDAQIGPVSVGGDWVASSLVAGVMNAPSGNTQFGTPGDQPIAAGDPSINSRIARVTIGGRVIGTTDPTDRFGFCAQQIGSFRVGGGAVSLTAGRDLVELSPATADVSVREV